MKKVLSLCLSAFMMFRIIPVLSFADDYNSQSQLEKHEMYKYEDFIKMTDEDFIKTFPNSKYVEAGFGDDSISFKEKLDNCYYLDFQIEGDCDHTMLVLHGNTDSHRQYIDVYVSRYIELDSSFDLSVIGFPSDWETEPIDIIERIYYDENGNELIQRRQVHKYRIYIPDEVFESFESFARFDNMINYSYKMKETERAKQYGITAVSDIFVQLLIGRDSTGCSNLYGDANLDYEVNLADAVLIMQYCANPAKYPIDEWGAINADMDGGGLTLKDALTIQQKLLSGD